MGFYERFARQDAATAITLSVLLSFGSVGCAREARALVERETPNEAVALPASEGRALNPREQRAGSDHAPVSAAVLPTASPRRAGHSVQVGRSHFMIWGAQSSGWMPKGLSSSPDGRWVFSSNMGLMDHDILTVFSGRPFARVMDFSLEGNSVESAVSPDSRWLFSTSMKDWGTLDVYDLATFERVRQLPVPGFPKLILPSMDGRSLYISLWARDAIARVRWPKGELAVLDLPGRSRYGEDRASKNPRGMALTRDEATLYVANNRDRSVSLVDVATFTERRRFDIGYAPRHIVRSPSGAHMYVSMTGHDAVFELDTATEAVTRELPVGSRPKTIALSRDGRFLYTANFKGHSVSIVDLATAESVELSLDIHKAMGLVVHASDRFVYVSGFCTNDVWAIERIDPGEAPTLPLGDDHDNRPCYDCPSSDLGCPGQRRRPG